MTIHVILGPAKCQVCWERVIWGWVEHMRGRGGVRHCWRDPATGKKHKCA